MYINKFIPQSYNNNSNSTQNNKQIICTPSFMARVDKGMARFYEVNADRMPLTVKTYIDSLTDKFSISPLEAQKKAFEKLQDAKNIEDVRNLFSLEAKEGLFQNLIPNIQTRATNGILSLFREFGDLYKSLLKSGEDFSLYLLKKIFMEAETIDEINLDLENDLHQDIVDVFKFRHGDSDFIHSSTLKALGISTPDVAYQNSLRFTRDGYSDEFGAKISEAQLRYWNSLTEEQKFEVLSKRLEGRDNWWNSLSYKEKLEYAAGIESKEECFHNYKKYVALQKRRKTYGNVGEEGSALNQVKLTQKKIAVGSKLDQKDIFSLWMKKNLENYYNSLSEADKDSVHMIRVRRLAVVWQSLSSQEKTERINKMKAGREPLQYIMIDAWNHSHNIIKELSKFLKEKQILKPLEMLYSSEAFSEFQSAIMTEFWDTHPEFATQFGENIKNAYEKVYDSINRGQFLDLQQEIKRCKADRKKLVERELAKEAEQAREAELMHQSVERDYQKEFAILYKKTFYPDNIMPESYVNDIISDFIKTNSKEELLKYMSYLKGEYFSKEYEKELENNINNVYSHDRFRYNRAIESAIADELGKRQITDLLGNPLHLHSNPALYDNVASTLQSLLIKNYKDNVANNIKKGNRINLKRIEDLYNKYKQDISIEELRSYVLNFFVPKINDDTAIDKLTEYIEAYGKTISMLFDEQSVYSSEAKIALKNKFYKFMPEDLKDKYAFLLETDRQVRNEKYIKQIDYELKQRFRFLDKEFLKNYLRELKYVCRNYSDTKEEAAEVYSPKSYLELMGQNRKKIQGNVINIVLPRYIISQNIKFTMLAMEQAMADELFEACGDEIVYKLSFETMCDLFEQAELLRTKPKLERKLIINDMLNGIFHEELLLNKIPNRMKINQKYYEYCNDFKEVEKLAKSENREVDEDDLLCWLNPIEGNDIRDDIVMNRIEKYYTENLLNECFDSQ